MDYYSYMSHTSSVNLMIAFLTLLFIAWGLSSIFTTRKSRQYRKEIVDMYVAAKTKDLASKEGLDLIAEYESFKKWLKKRRLEGSRIELDDVIEADLMDKVGEPKTSEKKK